MKKVSQLGLALLALGALSTPAFADLASDTALAGAVSSAFNAQNLPNASQVNVEAFDGTVQLSGFLDSQTQADAAKKIAGRVLGVKSVENDTIIKSDVNKGEFSTQAVNYANDTALTTKVKAALVKAGLGTAMDVSVETYGGIVQLSGFVDSQDQIAAAEKAARQVKGVKQVKNALDARSELTQTVKDTSKDGDISDDVKDALKADPRIPAGSVNVDVYNGVVQLNGFVNAKAEAKLAEKAAESVMGVVEVENNLIVRNKQGVVKAVGQKVADGLLTNSVKTALSNAYIPLDYVAISSYNGLVQVAGFVRNAEQEDNIINTVESVRGVDDVVVDLIKDSDVPVSAQSGSLANQPVVRSPADSSVTVIGTRVSGS